MDIDYALPGHLVAAFFEVLLIYAGYQVIPTGIERSLRELRTVQAETYRELAHPRLRFAPDFFVLDVEARQGWLTEISATRLDQQFFREAGRRIQDVFARLGDRWEDGTILKAQEAILRITAKQ